MLFRDAIAAVKRQNTATSRLVYRIGKSAIRAEVPAPKAIFTPMLTLHKLVTESSQQMIQRLYYQPMLRARCESCGPGLLLENGFPCISGPLRIRMGDHCWINGQTTFTSSSVLDGPQLTIGDHTYIGYGVTVSVGHSVTLGRHVKVADHCFICDNPGHPLDALERREKGVSAEDIRPVLIEDDVWLATRVIVLPGVRIGRGTVVGAGSVVTKDLPPFSLAAGNPARPLRRLQNAEALEEARRSVLGSSLS